MKIKQSTINPYIKYNRAYYSYLDKIIAKSRRKRMTRLFWDTYAWDVAIVASAFFCGFVCYVALWCI